MRKNKHDLTHREDADPVAKLSYWTGLLSIPKETLALQDQIQYSHDSVDRS